MEDINNIITSDVSSQSKQNVFKYLFIISLFIIFTLGTFYYLSIKKNNKTSSSNNAESTEKNLTIRPKENVNTIPLWSKPVPVGKSIPIVKDDLLFTYSLTNKKLEQTEYKTKWGGGALGFGESDPLPSPDGQFIAFINKLDNSSLYILPSGVKKAVKITNYPIEYINSWSSDSSKILFYSEKDDLIFRKTGGEMSADMYQSNWETKESFNKNFNQGFHSFNINNGADIYLYPLLTVNKFIDSNRIIIETDVADSTIGKRLVVFNVDDFTADYSTVNYQIKSFGFQDSYSADGSNWATSTDDDTTENSGRIIFAKFPLEQGTLVDSGSWGMLNNPLLNSTGRYLAYNKKGEQIRPGFYLPKTIIWDSFSKKIVKELDGYPQYWIDKNILFVKMLQNTENMSYYIFNIDTQEKNDIQVK